MQDFDRFGMPLGWAMITFGTVVTWLHEHGNGLLIGSSIVFGMVCQGYTTYLRHIATFQSKDKAPK